MFFEPYVASLLKELDSILAASMLKVNYFPFQATFNSHKIDPITYS